MNSATKIAIYAGMNALNAARITGITMASNAARSALYKGNLSVPIEVFDKYNDRLINDGCLLENTVILRTDSGIEIEILDAVIDITKSNDIKATALVNRAGTVKERIQEKDYSITVKGSFAADKDKFPYREMYLLNQILSEAKSMQISSVYTCLFDIDKVVFKSTDFNQSQWKYFNVMPFTLKFDSDTDYDFLVSE